MSLIQRDEERTEADVFDRLKAELNHVVAAQEATYMSLTAVGVIAQSQGLGWILLALCSYAERGFSWGRRLICTTNVIERPLRQ